MVWQFLFILLILIISYCIYQYDAYITRRYAITERDQLHPLDLHQSPTSTIAYLDEGNGPAIIALHDLGSDPYSLRNYFAGLAQSYRLIMPARYGYYGSHTHVASDVIQQSKAIAHLIESLGLQQVTILSTGIASFTAIQLALLEKKIVSKLILISPTLPQGAPNQKSLLNLELKGLLQSDFILFLLKPFAHAHLNFPGNRITQLIPIQEKIEGIRLDQATSRLEPLKPSDSYPLEELQCPCLIIHAKDDPYAPYTDAIKFENRFPHLECTFLESGGHFLENKQTEVIQAINHFIKQ